MKSSVRSLHEKGLEILADLFFDSKKKGCGQMGQPTAEQCKKFAKMADEKNMEMLQYLSVFSFSYLGKKVKKADQMTEGEAQTWIERYENEV